MTEHDSDPDRPRLHWRIPPRIYGRVRTSTVVIGICFVLTALLYDQVRVVPEPAQTGPQAVDTSQYTQQPGYRSEYSEPSTTESPTTTDQSTTADPSTTGTGTEPGGRSGQTGSQTGESGTSTTADPTYLPGMTVPPELRSLFPPAPQEPSTTGTP